jgi:REP element-mobilizing transposase RayT
MPGPNLQLVHAIFRSYAERAQAYNIAVGRYVIMSDHIHLFVTGDLISFFRDGSAG